MARARQFRRRATPATPEARIEASAIQDMRRRGYTNQQIGDLLGINERTVRKIVAGETSGRRIYARAIPDYGERRPQTRSTFRLDLRLPGGEIRTVNVKLPDIVGAGGARRAPTPFDVYRFPNLITVAEAERRAMARRYSMIDPDADDVEDYFTEPAIAGLRPIFRRNPDKRLVTIRGAFA